ncbi:MAG: radical SAM protein [Candidatus Omnitrophica bacterium]|nr:radical SAM protein [Candidatus Omnitrophota bacterium]
MKKDFRYIYGPVPSWRLGSSLGIDLLSQADKVCSFDCIYCQIGKTKRCSVKKKLYVSSEKIVRELKRLPDVHIDYITFSGRGEPTLAKNLGQTIKAVKGMRKEPIAVLTNASLLFRKEVRKALALADLVALKLDADSQRLLNQVNQPAGTITFTKILKGIRVFRKEYRGKLALQIMFMKKNKKAAKKMAELAKAICPDEVQLNTPTRPSRVRPLSRKDMAGIKRYFRGMKAVSIYEAKRKKVRPISKKDTMTRRGKKIE